MELVARGPAALAKKKRKEKKREGKKINRCSHTHYGEHEPAPLCLSKCLHYGSAWNNAGAASRSRPSIDVSRKQELDGGKNKERRRGGRG